MSKSCCKYQPAWCRCSHKEAECTDCRHSKVSGRPRPEQNNPSSDAIVKISQQPRFICAIQFSFPFFITFASLDLFLCWEKKWLNTKTKSVKKSFSFPWTNYQLLLGPSIYWLHASHTWVTETWKSRIAGICIYTSATFEGKPFSLLYRSRSSQNKLSGH